MLLLEKGWGEFAIVSIDDFMKLSTSETIYEDDVYEISGDMCQKVLELLTSAPGVIIDHVITSPRIYEELETLLGAHMLHRVHVDCPLEVLLEREQARGNRCVGSAQASFDYLYPKEGYALTVNTHTMDTTTCAEEICALLR